MNLKKPVPSKWQLLKEQLYSDCRIFKVFKNHYKHPTGKEGDFFVIKSNDWVQVVAMTPPPYHLVMIRQYRFGIDKISWELPGGVIEKNEDPIAGGTRELREETGYLGQNPIILGSCSPNPAIQTNKSHFVFIQNCELKAPLALDEDEEIEVSLIPLPKVFEMLHNGELEHTLMINALYKFQFYLTSNKLLDSPSQAHTNKL